MEWGWRGGGERAYSFSTSMIDMTLCRIIVAFPVDQFLSARIAGFLETFWSLF